MASKKNIAVITGDIVHSRLQKSRVWLPKLKKGLNAFGSPTVDWEIFRGDSFQLQLPPGKALQASFYLKSLLKQLPGLDVRIGIGIGEKNYTAKKITESNGPAFVFAGTAFDNLKKYNFAVKTANDEVTGSLNLMLELLSVVTGNWTPVTASLVQAIIMEDSISQEELSKTLKKSQSTISEGLRRAGYDEIKLVMAYFDKEINKL